MVYELCQAYESIMQLTLPRLTAFAEHQLPYHV